MEGMQRRCPLALLLTGRWIFRATTNAKRKEVFVRLSILTAFVIAYAIAASAWICHAMLTAPSSISIF
jgi:hypothetical protein